MLQRTNVEPALSGELPLVVKAACGKNPKGLPVESTSREACRGEQLEASLSTEMACRLVPTALKTSGVVKNAALTSDAAYSAAIGACAENFTVRQQHL